MDRYLLWPLDWDIFPSELSYLDQKHHISYKKCPPSELIPSFLLDIL